MLFDYPSAPLPHHHMGSKRSSYILNDLQSYPNFPHSPNVFPSSNSYCPCFHIIPVRQEKLSAWWLGGGAGGGGGMDQSVTVSMCRNRVIVTGLPAIQPAHQLCNPLARTSIHQPENQSVRKPACKSASSGLASYYIVKTY